MLFWSVVVKQCIVQKGQLGVEYEPEGLLIINSLLAKHISGGHGSEMAGPITVMHGDTAAYWKHTSLKV